MPYEDEEYFIPLEDQRVFGAGIKRKRVPFIPSSDGTSLSTTISAPATTSSSPAPSSSISDKYLSIVLSSHQAGTSSTKLPSSSASTPTSTSTTDEIQLCEVCNLPLTADTGNDSSTQSQTKPSHPHESLLAHQVCLPHSHPPSAIDRKRPGYRYLSSLGWDADSRSGLGPTGQGIRVPLKGKMKNDTAGLGVKIRLDQKEDGQPNRAVKADRYPRKLNAKQIRKMEEEGKKRGDKLRDMFYRTEDIDKYLGGG